MNATCNPSDRKFLPLKGKDFIISFLSREEWSEERYTKYSVNDITNSRMYTLESMHF